MQIPKGYNAASFQLPKEFLREITQLKPSKSLTAIAQVWAALLAIIWITLYVIPVKYFWVSYIPAVFLIASRYGALLQLIHEAAHNLLAHSKKKNLFLARWLCAYPVGVFLDGYISGHMKHHAWTNTSNDPPSDTEKYRVVDFRKPELYILFLKDILGITALSIFFQYKENDDAIHMEPAEFSKIRAFFHIAFVQGLLLLFVFHLDVVNYLLLWLVPAISPHMFLMRIRGIAEHGLAKQLGINVQHSYEGNFLTRSFATAQKHYSFLPLVWAERILIGSFNVYHHHEHHLFPTVPFYNLPILHKSIASKVSSLNPDVYVDGYFAAALRTILVKEPTPAFNAGPAGV